MPEPIRSPLESPAATPQQGRLIVAECSKTWSAADRLTEASPSHLLAHNFEHVLNVNEARGYRLVDWRFSQVAIPDQFGGQLVETIVAIFERVEDE